MLTVLPWDLWFRASDYFPLLWYVFSFLFRKSHTPVASTKHAGLVEAFYDFFTHLNPIRASTLLGTLLRSISPTLSPTYLARCGTCRRHLDPHRAAGTPVRVWAVNLLPCLFAIYLALHLSCTSPSLHFIFLALHSSCTSPFLALHLFLHFTFLHFSFPELHLYISST